VIVLISNNQNIFSLPSMRLCDYKSFRKLAMQVQWSKFSQIRISKIWYQWIGLQKARGNYKGQTPKPQGYSEIGV
jgi:hypothetical protein